MRPTVMLCLLGAIIAKVQGQLNLSPQREELTLDAIRLWRLTFENGTAKKASYQPPSDWAYSGGADELTLHPPGRSQAQVVITKISLQDAIPINGKERDKVGQKVIGSLPEGSQEVTIDEEGAGPVQIGGKETYLVQLSYTYYGEKFCRYCLFLNLKEAQLRFQLTSLAGDYKELAQAFQKSLYSWQHLPTT